MNIMKIHVRPTNPSWALVFNMIRGNATFMQISKTYSPLIFLAVLISWLANERSRRDYGDEWGG